MVLKECGLTNEMELLVGSADKNVPFLPTHAQARAMYELRNDQRCRASFPPGYFVWPEDRERVESQGQFHVTTNGQAPFPAPS